MNVVQLPVPDLPYGAAPGAPNSDVRVILVFDYDWQDDVAIIPKVPDEPRTM